MTFENQANYRRFEIRFRRDRDELHKGAIRAAVHKIARQALRGVVKRSPVGNPSLWKNPQNVPPGYVGGMFRSNWFVDVGTLVPRRERKNLSGGAVIARGETTIASAPAFTQIFLHNSMPYAERIENGWSEQAPQGTIPATIAQIEVQFARFR